VKGRLGGGFRRGKKAEGWGVRGSRHGERM
jgi:hypothetical protein